MSRLVGQLRVPLTQPLPLAGARSMRKTNFIFLSPSGERLGEGAATP